MNVTPSASAAWRSFIDRVALETGRLLQGNPIASTLIGAQQAPADWAAS